MSEPRRRVSGIVLAGGRSRRFGRDKLDEPLGGRPLLVSAVEAVASVCAEAIVVIGPDGAPPAIPAGVVVPVRIVRDSEREGGPLVGILAGLEAAAQPLALVAGGDMPWLQPAVLRLLLDEADRRGVLAMALRCDGRDQQLPIVLRVADALTIGRRLLGEGSRRVEALLAGLGSDAVAEASWRALDPGALTLRDVDRPEDLEGRSSADPLA